MNRTNDDAAGLRRIVPALWFSAILAVGFEAAADQPASANPPNPPALGVARQGQIILSPEPDFDAPSPVREALAAMAPGAGPVAGSKPLTFDNGLATDDPTPGSVGCPQPDGWQVVVIRGGQAPEVTRGRVIAVTPPGC